MRYLPLRPPLDLELVRVMNALPKLVPVRGRRHYWAEMGVRVEAWDVKVLPGLQVFVGCGGPPEVHWTITANRFAPLAFYAKQIRRMTRWINDRHVRRDRQIDKDLATAYRREHMKKLHYKE